jgi:hypothetical protein
MRITFVLVALSVLLGCADAASGALENQSLGRITGFFTRLTPDQVLCNLSDVGATQLRLTMPFSINGEGDKKVATFELPPLEPKQERVHVLGSFQYQTGEFTTGAAELERFAAIVDPRLSEESKTSNRELRTSLWFPLHLHRARVEGATLCDTTLSGAKTSDCLTVPDSTIEGARFWCSIGPSTPPKYSE